MAEIVQSSSHPTKCSKNYVVRNGGNRNNDKNSYKENYFPHMNELRTSDNDNENRVTNFRPNLDFRQSVDHHQPTSVSSMSANFSNTVSDPDMKYSYQEGTRSKNESNENPRGSDSRAANVKLEVCDDGRLEAEFIQKNNPSFVQKQEVSIAQEKAIKLELCQTVSIPKLKNLLL